MESYRDLAINPFELKIQSRLIDTDSLGHLSNVAYIEYLETTRTEWHKHVRKNRKAVENWDWILAGININYRREGFLSDELIVKMWCSRIGNKSWDFSYAIVNQDDQVIAEARTSQISFNYEQKVSMEISEDIIRDLKNRLGKPWSETK